jgi:hypothetical protein
MNIDVIFTADMLIGLFPENAAAEALARADNLMKAGDPAAAAKLAEVAAVIAERQAAGRARPGLAN